MSKEKWSYAKSMIKIEEFLKPFNLIEKYKRKKIKEIAEYIKPGTKIMYQGRVLTISNSYPSKEYGYMYVTTIGTTLYRNEFNIIW